MKNFILSAFIILTQLFLPTSFAQVTINTNLLGTGYTGSTSTSTNSFITWVIENNSGIPQTLTTVGTWANTGFNGTTATLWYSSSSLSGAVTLATPTWTNIASTTVSGVSTTGMATIFSGLTFVVPNNTQYRFALNVSTVSILYSSSGSPNSFTQSGISMYTGNYQIASANVGYVLTINPRYYCGFNTFVPAGPPCNAPTGLAASSVTNNSASLNWNAVAGSLGYEYALTSSATPPASGTTIAGTNYPASGLSSNTTYYMHVRNKCTSTQFSSWATTSFTTVNFISCYAPATVSASNMTSSTATISWASVSPSQGYEYVINQTAGAPAGNGTAINTTSVPVTGLTGGTSYYAHVRNVCQPTDKSVWMNYQFITPVCNKPTNVLISNVQDTSADLLWSMMPNANGYDYAVDFTKQDPTTGINHTTGITTHLSSLFPNSKYYIHIRSRCFGFDTSGWRLDSFISKMECFTPMPEINFLGTNNPVASWDPIPTVVAYEYALTNFHNPPAFGQNIYTTSVSLNLPEDGKDYYLHVRAKCNSQFTFSNWASVALRTGSTGIHPVQADNNTRLYPNPVQNSLYLDGATEGNTYTVYDMTGRMVINGMVQHKVSEINTTGIAPGVYTLKLEHRNQVLRFIKE